MGGSKSILIKFDTEFCERIKRAAELSNMNFSEFIRYSASREAENVYLRNGVVCPDLNGWHMQAGGDYSEARAAKDPNYRKRNILKKIEAAKKEAAKRINK